MQSTRLNSNKTIFGAIVYAAEVRLQKSGMESEWVAVRAVVLFVIMLMCPFVLRMLDN